MATDDTLERMLAAKAQDPSQGGSRPRSRSNSGFFGLGMESTRSGVTTVSRGVVTEAPRGKVQSTQTVLVGEVAAVPLGLGGRPSQGVRGLVRKPPRRGPGLVVEAVVEAQALALAPRPDLVPDADARLPGLRHLSTTPQRQPLPSPT